MRINDAYKTPHIGPSVIKPAGTSDARGSGGAPEVAKGDTDSVKVHISDRARGLSQAGSAGFDAAKVERLKGLVESGKFEVDPQAVANGIVNESSS